MYNEFVLNFLNLRRYFYYKLINLESYNEIIGICFIDVL